MVAKHAIGSVRIRLSGWVFHVGDERMVIHLHHRGRAGGVSQCQSRWLPSALAARRTAGIGSVFSSWSGCGGGTGGRWPLDGLSFTVEPGQIFGFLGPNGPAPDALPEAAC